LQMHQLPAKVEDMLTAMGMREPALDLSELAVGLPRETKAANLDLLNLWFPKFHGLATAAKRLPGLVPFFENEDFMPGAQHSDTNEQHVCVCVCVFVCDSDGRCV